jgi:hypothetical protein
VVACSLLDTRFAGSNPTRDDGILREMEIRRTTSFGGEVKPEHPYRKTLRQVKGPYKYEREISSAKFPG